MSARKATKREALEYVDRLHREGRTNMQHGSTIRLQNDLGLGETAAREIVARWFRSGSLVRQVLG